jgi:hypothetical protein
MAHLMDKDLIHGLDIRVPFCSHGSGDREFCDRICLIGQEEEGAFFARSSTLFFKYMLKHLLPIEKMG